MFHRSKKERPRPVTLTPPYDPGPSRGRGEPSPVEVNTIRISESMKLEPYYGFTNVAPYEVIYKNKEYPTAEHLFQAMKFLPDQPRIAEHIRTMDMVLDKKFEQHPELQRKLLETEQAYLILENGSKDTFWGNGDGDGLNRFGQALMRLREKLRSQR
ncbi:hypothetical protein FRB99_008237 [Tulasnella sp. 403]|nr:hypothetical protein FRB99_008237 [Tulasnella sp. 403]